MPALTRDDLSIPALTRDYASGARAPAQVLADVMARIHSHPRKNIWIRILPEAHIADQLARAQASKNAGKPLPLFGIPFAVKDNIDLAEVPTTAACPAFAYTPSRSATVVQRLLDAGAIAVGKTNMDQFATGLVGTRSPHGACENAFDPSYISGGSSAGSAVAVATDLATFSLGTDTAGSGRVPASFNGLVGLKPTRGLLSNTGVVPACRSLDCVSIFARNCADAADVLKVAAGFDDADPLSRPAPSEIKFPIPGVRCGVPRPDQFEFFDNAAAAVLFEQAVERARKLGATIVSIDYEPFRGTAELLYEGPWVVERHLAAGNIYRNNPDALRPEMRAILKSAERFTAADVFDGLHALASLRRQADVQWTRMDVMLLPTTGTIYTQAQVEADPLRLNRNLGFYTNFVNLLDLSAIAVPNGMLPAGVPMGITFMARAFRESPLLAIGSAFGAQVEGVSL